MPPPLRSRLDVLERRAPPPADMAEFARLVETLTPEQRRALEEVIDDLIAGKVTRAEAEKRAFVAVGHPAGWVGLPGVPG